MIYTPKKKRIIVLIIDLLFIAALISLYLFLPTIMASSPGCLFAKLDLPCLGCGGTRCVKAFIHLQLADAFLYNPFVFICILLAIFFLATINLAWVFNVKKARKLFDELSNPRYVIIFLVVFIIYAVLRITGICPVP